MHTYAFEVKMYATVEISAASRVEAEKLLDVFVNDPFGAAPSIDGLSATFMSVNLNEDDANYPYLAGYDGIDVEMLEDPDEIV
jgi:hypothetical protein